MQDGARRWAAAGATLVLLATGVYFTLVRPRAPRSTHDAAEDEDPTASAEPPPAAITTASGEATDAASPARPVLD